MRKDFGFRVWDKEENKYSTDTFYISTKTNGLSFLLEGLCA